ncbi:hypothetical protein SAMN05443428_11128 [Caloramator quimbayensis]|uniref:Bacteriophage holin of superfamily 6 (Holin_LLH) n=1 Tax=Caloramator quimbayensis TaxID=1147123 RepID=A0A1T4XNX4_9CLOT|nr:hypothetical protein [Caloramator quimbayensis]SKA91242.1 hypothetical protein SAMN05443428_11128 [Caloramator quimbayensis]
MAYWGIITTVVILIIYYLVNRTLAKKIALELMLYIEKRAEEFSISEGKDKLEWVVSQYDKLPAVIKSVITKDGFRLLIQELFDEAMKLLKNNTQSSP